MTYIGSLQGGASTANSSGSINLTPGSGLSGLSSGINTDAMVQGLMDAAQLPLVQLLQQRQVLQWQETRLQQVNASLSTLRDATQNMQLQSTFLANQTASSNPNIVTATASPTAPQGSYSVSVSQLAQGSTVFSSSSINTTDPNYASNTTLSSLGTAYSTGVTLNINGQSFTFAGTDTLQSVLNDINSNTSVGVNGFYDSNSNKFIFQTTSTGSGAMINVDNATASFFSAAFDITNSQVTTGLTGTTNLSSGISTTSPVTVTINGVKMQLSGNLAAIEQTINSNQAQTGVTATDNGTNIILKATSTGTTGSSNQLLSAISVYDPSNALGIPAYTGATAQQVAQDAQYSVNGLTETSSTNQPTFNGINLDLLSKTAPTTPVQVSVSADVSGITKSIEKFVQQYNQTLQLMQGLYNEKRDYSYQPLTSQQASQMTTTQVEQWTGKAQAGVLESNTTLSGIMNTMESDIQTIVSGQPSSNVNGQNVTLNSLAQIGITPIDPRTGVSSGATAPGVTTTGWNTYGLLQIDTTKLQNAIQADPQAVMRLFTNNPSLSGSASGVGTGVGVQLYDDLNAQIKTLTQQVGSNPNVNSLIQTTSSTSATISTAGLIISTPIDPNANFTSLFGIDGFDTSYMGQQISSMDTQATNMQQQLNSLKQMYQRQFTQMEQSLSQLNSQSGGLMSMIGGGTSSGSSTSGG